MRKFFATLMACVFGAFLASCDLQPKITALPDTVGDFISARYPAMLADPDTEPEIYNSAVSDYGVYASPELYGSVDMDDYVNYAAVDDYILKPEPAVEVVEQKSAVANTEPKVSVADNVPDESPVDTEPDDMLDIPEYKNDELNVPARAAPGAVIVRRGDTLYAIAHENNTTVADLARVNKLKEPYTIKIGQTLKLKTEPEPVKALVVEEKKPELIKQATEKTALQKAAPKAAEPKKVEQKSVTKQAEKTAIEKTKDVRVPLKTVTVARGDTLYSLSRKYEIPVNDLAVMNDLRTPFALNAGQKLRVPDLPEPKVNASVVQSPAKASSQPKVATKNVTEKSAPAKNATEKPKSKSAEKMPAKQTTKPAQTKTESKPQKQTAQTKSSGTTKSQSVPMRSSSKFTWPVRGTILSHYGAKSGGLYNDGINISAAAGATVVAAENGVVAYAGNEVRGMGNLIIIQHADGWMTVYAHLNSMAVRRGVRVSVGQKIGTVGQTGKVTKPQLHFEIRKGTKSYNPTNYLKK